MYWYPKNRPAVRLALALHRWPVCADNFEPVLAGFASRPPVELGSARRCWGTARGQVSAKVSCWPDWPYWI